jgi:hypothetical protein
MDGIQRLRETIWRERDCYVRFAVQDRTTPAPADASTLLDEFVQSLGLRPMGPRGDQWREISGEAAFRHVAVLMHEDSVYKGEIMPTSRAKELAEQVLDAVPNARYFTNTETEDGFVAWGSGFRIKDWNSITDATVDTGILMLSDFRIGIFWVEDED